MSQMIAHYAVTEYARFKTAFDADAKAARAWLEGAAGVFNPQVSVTAAGFHFVETA